MSALAIAEQSLRIQFSVQTLHHAGRLGTRLQVGGTGNFFADADSETAAIYGGPRRIGTTGVAGGHSLMVVTGIRLRRLVRLVDAPLEHKVLTPLIIKEIVFRLLMGGQGARLNHLLTLTGDAQRISKAIGYLRENFHHAIRIDDVAHQLSMSVSSFHHHFKSATAMSPLQFQKQIRLQEARRLMLGEDLDAASAGYQVGYEDPAYFSRDYKKLFGNPPQRDIAKLRSDLR